MGKSRSDDASLDALLTASASRGTVAPFRLYARAVLETTADGLVGLLSPAQVAVECDAAYAALLDAVPPSDPRAPAFRAGLMPLLTTAVDKGLSPDQLQSGIDTLLLGL